MCEVTWNIWEHVSVVDAKCMSFHALRRLRFRSLSFLLSVSVVVFWLSSLLDARTLWTHHSHLHVSCARWEIASPSPFTSSLFSSSLLSSCSSCCVTSPRTSAANDHFITELYVEYTQEFLTEQRFLEDFDYDDITIGQTLLMRAEDEPITLKKKACRPVCHSLQWVMIKRRNPLWHMTRARPQTCVPLKYKMVELRQAETNPTCKIHESCCTSAKIRVQNYPLGYICPGEPHERRPNAPKFERQSGKSKVPAKQRGSWPKVLVN